MNTVGLRECLGRVRDRCCHDPSAVATSMMDLAAVVEALIPAVREDAAPDPVPGQLAGHDAKMEERAALLAYLEKSRMELLRQVNDAKSLANRPLEDRCAATAHALKLLADDVREGKHREAGK